MTAKNSKKSSKKSASSTSAVSTPVTPAVTTSATSATAPPSISSADAAQCQALLTQLGDILGPVTELSTDDVRRSLKLRKGGSQVVTDLVALCQHHGITGVGPVTVASMTEQKARADTLGQIGVTFAAVQKKLNDATFSAESGTWQQATALYTVLQRLAVLNPTLAEGMAPVEAFFQTKKTKGTRRATAKDQKLASAEKLVAANQGSTSSASTAAAPPAAGTTSAGSTAAASNGTSVSAPVAATPVTASGVAHS
jgi:hypothetical protein